MQKRSITDDIRHFPTYLLLMAKRWTLWIAATLGIIAALAAIFMPHFALPQVAYWLIAALGLVWAGYRVYRDTVRRIPEKIMASPPPQITIGPVKGNEYSFLVLPGDNEYIIALHKSNITALRELQQREPDKAQEHQKQIDELTSEIKRLHRGDAIPAAQLELSVRIHNEDSRSFTIVSLGASPSNSSVDVWYTSFAEYFDSKGDTELQFPIDLGPDDLLVACIRTRIIASPKLNRAQFASRLPQPRETSEADFEITAQIRDQRGEIHTVSETCQVSFRPLRDLYLDRWRARSDDDLIDLARTRPGT